MKAKIFYAHIVSSKQLAKIPSKNTYVKLNHEGQQFPCPQCEYKATEKGSLQKHIKSIHEGQKLPNKLQKDLETLLSNDVAMEEYFETDVKSEVDSDNELDRSTVLKHEFLSDNDVEGMEEYFERDVKSEVESDVELD